MLPGLAQHIDFQPAHNDYSCGFLVVGKTDRTTVYGYVWEHTLSDGTTTWVAQPDTANDASRIAGSSPRSGPVSSCTSASGPSSSITRRPRPTSSRSRAAPSTCRAGRAPCASRIWPGAESSERAGCGRSRTAPVTTTCRARGRGRCVPARGPGPASLFLTSRPTYALESSCPLTPPPPS